MKAALALHAAHRQSELDQIRADLTQRYADDKVTLGGQTAAAPVLLDRLLKDQGPSIAADAATASSSETAIALADQVEPIWQMRFGDTVEAGMAPAELTQWESNALSAAVPVVSIDGSKLFANYLELPLRARLEERQDALAIGGVSPRRESPPCKTRPSSRTHRDMQSSPPENNVWTLSRDIKDGNFQAPFILACHRAENGEVIWQSKDLSDYAGLDLNGPADSGGGKNFHPGHRTGQSAAGPRRHATTRAGTPTARRQGDLEVRSRRAAARQPLHVVQLRWPAEGPAAPGLPRRGDLRGDSPGRLRAARRRFRNARTGVSPIRPTRCKGQNRFFWGDTCRRMEPTPTASLPISSGETFLFKGLQSTRLNALDPNRMKVALGTTDLQGLSLAGRRRSHRLSWWRRALARSTCKSRKLLWATRVPGGCANAQVLVRKDAIWQSTPRGIIELDPKSGDVRRFFRGKDLGSVGGDLMLSDQLLLAVSNRTIIGLSAHARVLGDRPRAVRLRPQTRGSTNE